MPVSWRPRRGTIYIASNSNEFILDIVQISEESIKLVMPEAE